jgi:hypothetical protein
VAGSGKAARSAALIVCSATDSTSGEQTFFVLKQWGGRIDPIPPTLFP